MRGKNDKKKKELPPKPPFAPIREPLEKPELTPEEELEELKRAYQEKGALYFSGPIETKISNIIALFSRTNEEIVTYSELRVRRVHQEILIATNTIQTYPAEALLKALFALLRVTNASKSVEGLNRRGVYLILTKKFRDADKKKDLMEAFEFLNLDEPKKPVEEGLEPEDPTMRTPKFYDHLVYNGYKYTDEMADVVVKEADPKNKGEFIYEKFVDHVTKTVKKKKKKRGGMKK